MGLLFLRINNLLEHMDHVIVLTMDVTHDYNWLLHFDNIWFALYIQMSNDDDRMTY